MSDTPNSKSDFDTKAAVAAAEGNRGYYHTLTWQQRLMVANYLNSIFYGYPENEPPKMDRTAFTVRAQDNS